MRRCILGIDTLPETTQQRYLVLLLAILFAGCLHFVNLPEESNWHRIQVTGAIVYAADPDSPIFARSVVRFPAGLNDFPQSRARLMRPLYSVAGWIVFQPLSLFEEFVPPGLARRVAAKMKEANNPDVWRGVDSRRLVLAWGSLVIVNVIMIWGSLVLVRRALLAIFPEPVATLLSASLPFHFTIIRWVYVPHTEPFDLLIPAVFLYTAARIWSRGGTGWMGASVLGILLLGKPIAFPAFNWLYEHLLSRPRRSGSIRTTLLLLGMLCAPTALYAGLLMKFGIRPEWFELSEYRQVIWMMDYVRAGRVSIFPSAGRTTWSRMCALHSLVSRRHSPLPASSRHFAKNAVRLICRRAWSDTSSHSSWPAACSGRW